METLAGFWSKPTLWVLALIVIALVLVAIAFMRMRPRKPPPAIRAPGPSWTAVDNLDSSHIGGPIFGDAAEQTNEPATGRPGGTGPAGAPK